MTERDLVDIFFKLIGIAAAIVAIQQLIEVKRKRLIDMYWKIAEIYYSEEQRKSRENIEDVSNLIQNLQAGGKGDNDIIAYYNAEYHVTKNSERKEIDKSIINRIRFLNQAGVLLRRNMIDKDLLFGLIGVGFQIDYPTIRLVLEAHRREHNIPSMYSAVEIVWSKYQQWKNTKV